MFKPPRLSDPDSLIISYLTLRKSVGVLGMSLPFVLVLGSFVLDQTFKLRSSLSDYYYSHIGNGLVGVLCAVSLFLLSYHGYKWYDSLASKCAGISALGIAFFPTSAPGIEANFISTLHYITAGIFFVVLSVMSIFLFTKSKGHKTPEKKKRNRVYIVCGIIMLVSVAGIPIDSISVVHNKISSLKPTLILETVALLAFGFSWLTKGEFFYKDSEEEKLSIIEVDIREEPIPGNIN